MNKVLVTGGAGYIGSHTAVSLIEAGIDPIIYDNLCNSDLEAIKRIGQITGKQPVFVEGDIRDKAKIEQTMSAYNIGSVIHFAGLKAVGESLEKPLEYYDNNVHGTMCIIEAMGKCGIKTLVFSSSANVYGDPASVPVKENFPRSASNPYGQSKLMVEDILADISRSDAEWRIARLRYFNPFGAHPSGLIGEDPKGVPSNLGPYVAQVAAGKLKELQVFGGDYPTRDGTGVRDFIHIMDLAEGHLAALAHIAANSGLLTVNLGTGTGYSVLELVDAFKSATGRDVPYRIVERRPADIAESYADPSLAHKLTNWRATRSLGDMCRDFWRWQEMNPNGYRNAKAA